MATTPTNSLTALQRHSIVLTAWILLLVMWLAKNANGQDQWSAAMQKINPSLGVPFEVDPQRVEAAGIDVFSGQHIDLYTNIRHNQRAMDLVSAFDQSVQPWCKYFGIDLTRAQNWKVRVFLIADFNNQQPFRQAGLLPNDLPEFKAGFQRRHDIWLYLQPGSYYTRHLLIHEGTHGFMQWFAGGYGAPWYSEGIAELFGVHRWKDGKLQPLYRLRNRNEAEYWGRVKRIKDEWAGGKAMSLSDVLNIPPRAFLEVRYYAWSWAGCEFFSKHEKSKTAFAELRKLAGVDPALFNQQFAKELQPVWDELQRDWELFIAEVEYGFEVDRGRLSIAKPKSSLGGKQTFEIRSERSWQVTNVEIKRGDQLRITGSGEFKIGSTPTQPPGQSIPWPCQSNGITIEYYRGKPLGMLQAGILDLTKADPKTQIKGLLEPLAIGTSSEIVATRDGTLCLRVNESPAKLDDNSGALEVTVEKLK